MGHIRINLEDSLHKNLKRRAIDEGITMRELLIKAVQEYIDRNPPLPSSTTANQTGKTQNKPGRKRSSV